MFIWRQFTSVMLYVFAYLVQVVRKVDELIFTIVFAKPPTAYENVIRRIAIIFNQTLATTDTTLFRAGLINNLPCG